MALTRIILVRHGQTAWNAEMRVQGCLPHSDQPLNAHGSQQAELIAQALASEPLAAIYASPLRRARQTAGPIAARHDLPVLIEDDLRELMQGSWEGRTFAEIRSAEADRLREWLTQPATFCLEDGESLSQLQERAWTVIERIVAAHPDSTVVVVTHFLTIMTVLCRALAMDLTGFTRLRHDPAARSVLEFGGERGTRLASLNDTHHLTLASPAGQAT